MLKAKGYPAVGFECPKCGLYQCLPMGRIADCEGCGCKIEVSRPANPEAERLLRKVAHGCTDALCPDCDR